MAGLRFSVNAEDVPLAVAAWKTVCSVRAPTNQAVQCLRAAMFPEGVDGAAKPLGVRLTRITAGNGTATSTTPIKLDNRLSTTVQSTARRHFTGTEPTEDGTAQYLFVGKTHPQGALIQEVTFDDVFIKEGTEVALQLFVPTGGSGVNCTGNFYCEE
jgi:hypothetical protein